MYAREGKEWAGCVSVGCVWVLFSGCVCVLLSALFVRTLQVVCCHSLSCLLSLFHALCMRTLQWPV